MPCTKLGTENSEMQQTEFPHPLESMFQTTWSTVAAMSCQELEKWQVQDDMCNQYQYTQEFKGSTEKRMQNKSICILIAYQSDNILQIQSSKIHYEITPLVFFLFQCSCQMILNYVCVTHFLSIEQIKASPID